ncbi:MAG: SDR family oxidoreductase [Alphaproteobacteria bacterium]|nr:SDR family oxidoreductase [Alphaproteobacteria bacterium]
MDLDLEGKVALVSGGTKGCGLAIAAELAREGGRVVVASRSRDNVEAAVAEIGAAGGQVRGVAADMTTPDGVAAAVETAHAAFGPPLIAISNVNAPDGPTVERPRWGFEDVSDEEFDTGYEVLVRSVVLLTRAVLPAMKAARWGRLLNIGSKAVKVPHLPPSPMVLSNVGRMGVVRLMKDISLEYGIYNITANVIATGAFATTRSHAYFESRGLTIAEQEENLRKAAIGVSRFGRPEEMGWLAAFLCSDRAAFISGEVIGISGGMSVAMM